MTAPRTILESAATGDDTFATLAMLTPEALDALLGKAPGIRAPWWIHKGKVAVTDAASSRVKATFEAFARLGELPLGLA